MPTPNHNRLGCSFPPACFGFALFAVRQRSGPGTEKHPILRSIGSDCDTVWSNPVPVASLPKLSIRDGTNYTVERIVNGSALQYLFIAVDVRTGKVVEETAIGGSDALDTHELPMTISRDRTLYQPTTSGITKVMAMAGTPRLVDAGPC